MHKRLIIEKREGKFHQKTLQEKVDVWIIEGRRRKKLHSTPKNPVVLIEKDENYYVEKKGPQDVIVEVRDYDDLENFGVFDNKKMDDNNVPYMDRIVIPF